MTILETYLARMRKSRDALVRFARSVEAGSISADDVQHQARLALGRAGMDVDERTKREIAWLDGVDLTNGTSSGTVIEP